MDETKPTVFLGSSPLDGTLGILLVGIFINTYLFGIVSYQFAAYWATKFYDPLWLKSLVAFLAIVDLIHSIASCYMGYVYSVTNFGNASALAVQLWPLPFTPIVSALAAVLTHLFLGYRIYRLSGAVYVYATIAVLSVATFVLGVSIGIRAWLIVDAAKIPGLAPHAIAWLTFNVVLDITIAGTLIFILRKSRTGFSHTDVIVKTLIRGAVQTGFFAAVVSLCTLFAFTLTPRLDLYGAFAISLGRIYTNTLMDTLLARDRLKDRSRGSQGTHQSLSFDHGKQSQPNTSNAIRLSTRNVHTSGPPEIHIQKDTYSDADPTYGNKYGSSILPV